MHTYPVYKSHSEAETFKYADDLASDLKKTIRGEVRFDNGSRALYATDSSNYREIPIGVVLPTSIEDIQNVLAAARKYKVPVLSRGGGTSLAGQCCNAGIVMDMSKYYNKILEIDGAAKTATIQPGIVLDSLRDAVKVHGLTFGPDPATHTRCTIGGMIGNNSCGVHSVMAALNGGGARTSDNLVEMEIITYQGERMKVGATTEEELDQIIKAGGAKGEIYAKLKKLRDKYAPLIRERYPNIPRRVSGYNLDELLPENGFNVARALAGSESTLVTILEAKVSLIPEPKERTLLVLGFEDIYKAGKYAHEILKYKPIGLEGIDDKLIGFMKDRGLHVDDLPLLPKGQGWLLVEFGGDTPEACNQQAEKVKSDFLIKDKAIDACIYNKEADEKRIWEIRESGLGATAFVPDKKDAWEGWEDAAVPPEKVGDYLYDFRKLLNKYGYDTTTYGHFGQGVIHCRIDFELKTEKGLETFRNFLNDAADLVVSYGGSISGEHGDGQSKAQLLPKMFGEELIEAFNEFKAIWDPDGKMNPGKIVHPNPILSHLRLGIDYQPKQVKTHFSYKDDQGDFSRAVLRCVGVGECRQHHGKTMCPSYRVTLEEEHSTRGRAHMLFEMLQGEAIKDAWKSNAVKDALDLCLSCKGCKGDCPTKVDMATYKAEFLAHFYKGKIRPVHTYVFGLISRWARIASAMPKVANFITGSALTGPLVKKIIGVSKNRNMPRFAEETFKKWHAAKGQKARSGKKVLLWPDTFNNYFLPDTCKAAYTVLQNAGFDVVVPKVHLCCGRPLYDYGMLDIARKWLLRILHELRNEIEAGIPVIVLEPSCATVFRDELTDLLPNNKDALRLKRQTYLLSEFIEQNKEYFKFSTSAETAIVHGHCHHKSVLKFDSEEKLIKSLGLNYKALDSGCCGMAGAFGYEKKHYEVSVKAGKQVLIPAVEKTDPDTLIIADGFSCREQIEQMTGKKALHIAEVLRKMS